MNELCASIVDAHTHKQHNHKKTRQEILVARHVVSF